MRVNATNWRNTQEEIYLEETVLIIFSLLAALVLLVALANRLRIPYPILLVLAGFIISLIPGLPSIELDPSLVFILFLPPILQLSAYYTPIRDFRANLRSISLLAIGLVLATMVGVAIVAHALIPGLPWAAAFVLGAIVAPPDAVAASSIAQRLKLPRRIVTVLEGESMLNDATSLVSYRVAVAAVVTGVFSFWQAGAQFLLSSIGGVAIGIAVGLILTPLFRRLTQDIPVYLILTFLSGYGAYLLADRLQCSGVLAVVALGMFYIRVNTMTPELRIQGTAIWDIVVFLLNGLIFILIGLQMRSVIEHLSGRSLITLGWYAFIICLTAILIRIAWVFPGTYLPRLPARVRARDPFPPWQHAAIVAWTGMRGVVSLASALSLPLVLANGQPFPQRDLIIFLTSSVILVTLVFQGLTLPLLIRWLKIEDDGGSEREENKARLKAAQAAQARLKELASKDDAKAEVLERMSRRYENRIRLFSGRYHNNQDEDAEKRFTGFGKLELDLLEAEQAALIKLRNDEVINDEVLRTVQRDLDLEWLRLQDD